MTVADIVVCIILSIVIILIVYNQYIRENHSDCKGCNKADHCKLSKKSNWIEEYRRDNCHKDM